MTIGYVEAMCVVPSSVTLSATNNGGGPTSVALTAGSYYISDLCSHLQTQLNTLRPGSGGATWTVSISLSSDGATGKVTISMSAGTFSITWPTSTLGTLLGHSTITTQTSVTGASAAYGVFIPDRPLNVEGDPRSAPMVTDLRDTEGPTGLIYGFVGNLKYRHRLLRWAHVSRERTWDTDSGATPSWERFIKSAQLGSGHSWFTPCSEMKIVDHTGQRLGSDFGNIGWQLKGIRSVEPKKSSDAWTGAWTIEVPELVSDGT